MSSTTASRSPRARSRSANAAKQLMTPRTLLKSCAAPLVTVPRLSRRWACKVRALRARSVRRNRLSPMLARHGRSEQRAAGQLDRLRGDALVERDAGAADEVDADDGMVDRVADEDHGDRRGRDDGRG